MRPSTGSGGLGTNLIMVRRRRTQAAIERRAGGFGPSDRMYREPGAIRVVVHRRRDGSRSLTHSRDPAQAERCRAQWRGRATGAANGRQGTMMLVTAPTRPPGVVLEAVLERLTYVNEQTGYTVARVATARGGDDLLTVVGALLGAQPGESLRLVGRWSSHATYGRQFEVDSYTTVLPATIQGIRRYLGSGLVKGIGPVFAERIVAHFDLDTLRVIEEQPGRLIEVPGLGPKRTAKITAAWAEQKAIKEVMLFLQTVGVSTSIAVRIFKQYADASITVVQTEPNRTGWPPRSGASGSRPPTRSPRRSGSRTTARNGSKPGCSTRCRRPPTTATATFPAPSWSPTPPRPWASPPRWWGRAWPSCPAKKAWSVSS